jgi:chromosome segregation ATPase
VNQLWTLAGSVVLVVLTWFGARRKDTAEVEQIAAEVERIAVDTMTTVVSAVRSEMQELRDQLAAARADQAAARAEIAVLRHEVDEQRLTIVNLTSQLAREQAWSTWARNDRRRMYVWLEAQGLTPPPPETPEPVWPAEQGE